MQETSVQQFEELRFGSVIIQAGQQYVALVVYTTGELCNKQLQLQNSNGEKQERQITRWFTQSQTVHAAFFSTTPPGQYTLVWENKSVPIVLEAGKITQLGLGISFSLPTRTITKTVPMVLSPVIREDVPEREDELLPFQESEDEIGDDCLVLGSDIQTGRYVTLSQEERLKGFYVIGKTGSGKTTLLVNMILQDIEAGRGLCFFDTHGDAITDVLRWLPSHREKDVIFLDLLDKEATFGLNIFQCADPTDDEEVSSLNSAIMGMFAKLFTETGDIFRDAPTLAETLQVSIPVFLAHTNPRMTMAEIPLLLEDDTARKKLLAPVDNFLVEQFWRSYDRLKNELKERKTESTKRRITNFLIDPLALKIVGQSETTIPYRRIMDERKILLVKLSRRHEMLTNLIGSMMVAQIAQAAYSRVDTPEKDRVPFFLYADEYQRFCTPTFAELLAEVRKYKIGTCVAHQFRHQLDRANQGATLNAANMVVYQVSGEDAAELAIQFDSTPPPVEEEIEEEQIGEEEIKTPIRDVLGYLVGTKGEHPYPEVNQFAHDYARILYEDGKRATIKRIGSNEPYPNTTHYLATLNKILYEEMVGKRETMFSLDAIIFYLYVLNFTHHYCFISADMKQTPSTRYGATPQEVQALIDFFNAPLGSPQETEAQQLYFHIPLYDKDPLAFVHLLKQTMQALHAAPILAGNNQYRPIVRERKYTPPQLTSAEMQARNANRLTNPPQPYTARAKLGTREYTFAALPLKTPDPDYVWQERERRIIANTRQLYCKNRDEVNRTILERQGELTRRQPPTAQTTDDDDE
jgi:hypothetical protein